jgi:hypothetical protein
MIDGIKKEFDIVDINALADEDNWWSVILEQHEEGIM